jgi:hypothetical protein
MKYTSSCTRRGEPIRTCEDGVETGSELDDVSDPLTPPRVVDPGTIGKVHLYRSFCNEGDRFGRLTYNGWIAVLVDDESMMVHVVSLEPTRTCTVPVKPAQFCIVPTCVQPTGVIEARKKEHGVGLHDRIAHASVRQWQISRQRGTIDICISIPLRNCKPRSLIVTIPITTRKCGAVSGVTPSQLKRYFRLAAPEIR